MDMLTGHGNDRAPGRKKYNFDRATALGRFIVVVSKGNGIYSLTCTTHACQGKSGNFSTA